MGAWLYYVATPVLIPVFFECSRGLVRFVGGMTSFPRENSDAMERYADGLETVWTSASVVLQSDIYTGYFWFEIVAIICMIYRSVEPIRVGVAVRAAKHLARDTFPAIARVWRGEDDRPPSKGAPSPTDDDESQKEDQMYHRTHRRGTEVTRRNDENARGKTNAPSAEGAPSAGSFTFPSSSVSGDESRSASSLEEPLAERAPSAKTSSVGSRVGMVCNMER